MKIAVITPYFNETWDTLQRCARSIAAQTVPCEHIWVSDGSAMVPPDGRVVDLDHPHGDYGNVARGVGALLAAGDGYDAIAFLDADNWYDPNHIEECVKSATSYPNVDVVFARRRFCRPDGTDMKVNDEPNHVDTSCYFFLPGSYNALAYWATMPKPMSIVGDRVFLELLRTTEGLVVAHNKPITVNYLCMWESYYKLLGEAVPPGAKPNVDATAFEKWRAELKGRELEVANRLTGWRIK